MVVVGVRGEFEASREDAEMKKKKHTKKEGEGFLGERKKRDTK